MSGRSTRHDQQLYVFVGRECLPNAQRPFHDAMFGVLEF